MIIEKLSAGKSKHWAGLVDLNADAAPILPKPFRDFFLGWLETTIDSVHRKISEWSVQNRSSKAYIIAKNAEERDRDGN